MQNSDFKERHDKRKKLATVLFALLVTLAILLVGYLISGHKVVSVDQRLPTSIRQTSNTAFPDQPNTTKAISGTEFREQTEHILEQIGDQVLAVADLYEQQAKYPIFSRPVLDQELARPLAPFEEAKVKMRLADEDGTPSSVSVVVSTDKISYFFGDQIVAQLMVSGTEGNESIVATANIKRAGGGADLMTTDAQLDPLPTSGNGFQTVLDTSLINPDEATTELILKFDVNIDDEQVVATVPFFLNHASARLDNVAIPTQQGAFLQIPLEYSVFQSGYYFVSGYLYDRDTGRALLSLQTEGPMSSGNQLLVLKAHQQALRDSGSEGPYVLRVVRSFMGAAPGGAGDLPTKISQRQYSVPGFSFAGYSREPYVDPDVQERLELLRRLGSASN